MEEDKYQKELFELDKPSKPFSRIPNILPKADFEGKITVTFTLERLVFLSIAFFMVMILVFAVGVESGKSRRPYKAAPAAQMIPKVAIATAADKTAAVPAIAGSKTVPGQLSGTSQKAFFSTAPAAGLSFPAKQAEPRKAAVEPDRLKPYTIVAGSFSRKETAQSAVNLLSKEGIIASVIYAPPYYMVCAGSYSDAGSSGAQKDLVRVKRVFKDAFIKLR